MSVPLQIIIGSEVLGLILSGGAAAMIAAIVQAVRSLRDGARAEDRDAFADLDRERAKAVIQKNNAEKMRDYWHNRSAALQFVVVKNLGVEALPAELPVPELDKEDL